MTEETSKSQLEEGQQNKAVATTPANRTNEVEPPKQHDIIGKIPQWFVPAVGIIYATGFLIIITFLDRFSLRESSGDFFKVKYLHAGILFWMLPIIVIVPLYGFYFLKVTDKEDATNNREDVIEGEAGREEFKAYVSSAVLVTNLLFVFYIIAVFAPPGFAAQRDLLVLGMYLVTVIGIVSIRAITNWLKREGLSHRTGERLAYAARWLLCIGIVIGLDTYSLKGLGETLKAVAWPGGVYFFLFLLTTALIGERTRVRSRGITDWRRKTILKVIASCLMIATYYLSVLAFAYLIYPFIPVTKGGGDYVGAPTAQLCFQETNAKFLLPELLANSTPGENDCVKSKPVQIIEESATSVFVAFPDDAGGPGEWRRGNKPTVFEIRRDKIGSITFLNPNN